MINEVVLKRCRDCNVEKTWIKSDFRGGQYTYLDASGNSWHRTQCPECYKKWMREHNAKKRAAFRAVNPIQPKIRKNPGAYGHIGPNTKQYVCRSCGDKTWNYFNCPACLRKKDDYAYSEDLAFTVGFHEPSFGGGENG